MLASIAKIGLGQVEKTVIKIGIKSVSRNSHQLMRLIKDEFGFERAAFVPYCSTDCRILHNGLGCKEKVFNPCEKQELLNISRLIHPNNEKFDTNGSIGLYQIQVALKDICKKLEAENLYYPILDTIIRDAPAKLLLKGGKIESSEFDLLLARIFCKKKCYDSFDAVFLANSAYLMRGIIKSAFLETGRLAFYLNPRGQLLRYSKSNVSEFAACELKQDSGFYGSKKMIDEFLVCRFSGSGKVDIDSSEAFAVDSKNSSGKERKILFLHAFRGANNYTCWDNTQAFDSYLQWADETFAHISATNTWHDWYIKPHPSQIYYQDDDLLLDFLVRKHDIPDHVFKKCPPTKAILEKRLPVFTNQGTIVLETAIWGYKSYFCGPRFDGEFGIKCTSRDQWMTCLEIPMHEAVIEIDEIMRGYAGSELFKMFGFKNIEWACPRMPVMPGDTTRISIVKTISQIRNSISARINPMDFVIPII